MFLPVMIMFLSPGDSHVFPVASHGEGMDDILSQLATALGGQSESTN